jgi:hypothetical protein
MSELLLSGRLVQAAAEQCVWAVSVDVGVGWCEAVQCTEDEAYRYPLTDHSVRIKTMQKFDLRCICCVVFVSET